METGLKADLELVVNHLVAERLAAIVTELNKELAALGYFPDADVPRRVTLRAPAALRRAAGGGTCKVCGCTDARACAGGCSWVDETRTLCDACDAPTRDLGPVTHVKPKPKAQSPKPKKVAESAPKGLCTCGKAKKAGFKLCEDCILAAESSE